MQRRAFTLIELLVVIAIIAILAAILFPVFAQAKNAAKAATCLSNNKQMGIAFKLYIDSNEDTYAPAYCDRWPCAAWVISGMNPDVGLQKDKGCDKTVDPRNGWRYDLSCIANIENGGLFPFTKSKDVYKCPVEERAKYKFVNSPQLLNSKNNNITYTMNTQFTTLNASNEVTGLLPLRAGGIQYAAIGESVVQFPSTTFMLVDESVSTRNDSAFFPIDSRGQEADVFGLQHTDGAVMLMADTSAKRFPKTAVQVKGSLFKRFYVYRKDD